ncbi:hypothetical protein MMC16_003224 [Acarospora aff. strigata]|nr:hypothetical protein [Acarospora aff. strigata]
MKPTSFIFLALSVDGALSAALQVRVPAAESMQVAPRAEVSKTDTGISIMQADVREPTEISPSDDGIIEKRWSTACKTSCLAACLMSAGLPNWRAGITRIGRDFLSVFTICGAECVASGACFAGQPFAQPVVLSEAAQIFNEQKNLGLTDAIGGSSPAGGSPSG